MLFIKTLILKLTIFLCSILLISPSFSQSSDLDPEQIAQSINTLIGNPSALDSMEMALATAVAGNFILEDVYYYSLSKGHFLSGQLDKAFAMAEKGIALCKTNEKTEQMAKFYNLEASVYAYQKDNENAINSFKTSLEILEKSGDEYTAAQIQNNIANIFFGLNDFESAYTYSKLSYTRLSLLNDTAYLPAVAGILSVSALNLNRFDEGKKYADESLALSTQYNNPLGLIVSNYCMGDVHIESKEYALAIQNYNNSLELSTKYRQTHFEMLNKIGLQKAHFFNKEYEKSIEFGKNAAEESKALQNENTLYSINKHLGQAYGELEDYTQAFFHLTTAHEMYIESSGIENQKVINNILIKYDTEKKEKELMESRLDFLEGESKLHKRTQWIIVLVTLVALLTMGYIFYHRLQKERMTKLKKEEETNRLKAAVEAEEKERKRLSDELHDGMASAITGIKMKLEDLSEDASGAPLKPIVLQLQSLHDETRKMSHNLMPLGLNEENWASRLAEHCRENSSQRFKIQFSNNLRNKLSIDPVLSVLIHRSMQELIHNAQKHSNSDTCVVQVSQLEKQVIFSVEDEGIGFDSSKINGQGIGSMKKRLSDIGAELDIESRLGKGTMITISLPLL